MEMILWLWVSIFFNLICFILMMVMAYLIINSLRKIETYEDAINTFFEGSLSILTTARALDEKNMFEKDDDVGILFEQLLTVIGELRVLIYAEEKEEV